MVDSSGDTILFDCDDRMKKWLLKQCDKELADMLARCEAAERKARQQIYLNQMEQDNAGKEI